MSGIRDKLPADEVMREMARIANQAAIETVARQAEEFANDPMVRGLNGQQAMLAFARAMRSTSNKVWPNTGASA